MRRIGRLASGIALGLALAFGAVGNASADTTYTYVGNNFDTIVDAPFPPGSYDTSMGVSGSITVVSALNPNLANADISGVILAFEFTDGRQTFTEASTACAGGTSRGQLCADDSECPGGGVCVDLPVKVFRVSTSATGQITNWLVNTSTAQSFPRMTISTENRFVVRDRGEMIFQIGAIDSAAVSGSAGSWSSIQFDLDIKPWSDPNAINPFSRGAIPVAILGSETFDVTVVDVDTLAFGPAGAAPRHKVGGHLQDVDEDGFTDLVSHYWIAETGIQMGDVEACVTGETLDAEPFEECDDIATDPNACGFGFELALLMPPLMWLRRRLKSSR
jgi:hypothetical protein